MLIKSKAIVLGKRKYNDAYDIVTLYTQEAGTVSFIVTIPKTRKASTKSIVFQPLNQLLIEWDNKESRHLFRIRNMQCDYLYSSMHSHPYKIAIKAYLSEFLYYALRNELSSDPRLYRYLCSSLQWLDTAQKDYSNFHIALSIQLTTFLGIFPNTGAYDRTARFDMLNSCFTLSQPNHSHVLPSSEAEHLPLLLRMRVANMHLFHFNASQRSRILTLINTYYQLHIDGFPKLQSIQILHDIFS